MAVIFFFEVSFFADFFLRAGAGVLFGECVTDQAAVAFG